MQYNPVIFSERLRQERTAKEFTQKMMADKLGISQSTYKGYELVGQKNGREPSFEMLVKIAQIFDVSIDYLLGFSD